MDWSHGYYANSGYSFGYYAETMPARLRWAALLQGHILPEKNFRYLDAGCGQGLNLILAAMMHPDSEFVGIDFLPEHVANARAIIELCGLTNVTVIEGDFIELSKDPSSLGEFDMAVCHGIATWIGDDVKRPLFKLIGQVLKPGGLFYNSYNTHPGWLSAVPFQHLVLLEQRSKSGTEALAGARQTLQRLNENAENLFKGLPGLPIRLKNLETQDPAYLLQEYNNQHWRPVFVSEMLDQMTAVKLDFLGTATLPDAFESVLKAEVRELIKSQPNVVMREQIRDYVIAQSFRRDLYVKGKNQSFEPGHSERLRALRVVSNPLLPRPTGEQPYKIKGSSQELLGNAEFYNSLLAVIDASPDGATVGQVVDAEPDVRRKRNVFETLSMMMTGGWITPRIEVSNPRGREIGAAIARAICDGAPHRYAPLPATGTAIRLAETDWILVKLFGEDGSTEGKVEQLLAALTRLNRKLAKEGKPVDNPDEQQEVAAKIVADFTAKALPYFRSVGLL